MTTKDLVGFHEEIMREVVSMDGLWVLGAGLGLRSLTQTIIEQYEAFKELVIVLNVEPSHFDPLFGERHQQVVAEVTAAQRSRPFPPLDLSSTFLRTRSLLHALVPRAVEILDANYR